MEKTILRVESEHEQPLTITVRYNVGDMVYLTMDTEQCHRMVVNWVYIHNQKE